MTTKKTKVEKPAAEKQSNISQGEKKVGGARPGAGRPKGSIDKGNALIREMIVQALDQVGGVDYLVQQALEQPKAFLSLIGKVMPVQLEQAGGGAFQVEVIRRTIVDPKGAV